MTIIPRFSLILATALICMLFSIAQAQTPRMATVNITPDSDKVHISAQGDVVEMRIEVVSEAGDVVFESRAISGSTLDWNMKDSQDERVAAGTYMVTVTFRTAAGKSRKRVEQVTVGEAEKPDTQKAAATAAPQAVQATVVTYGSPVAGRIPKFYNSSAITNSVVTESAGKIGINNPVPKHTLSILNGPTWTANGWRGAIELGNATAIGWQKNSANWRFGMGHSTDGFVMFRTLADPGTQTTNKALYDFFISNEGRVGIGTTSPTFTKLKVVGGTSADGVEDDGIIASGQYGVRGYGSLVGVFGSGSDIGVFSAGRLVVSVIASGGNKQLCWDSSDGSIATCGSSLRYKTDLQPFGGGLNIINRLRPIAYKWKSDHTPDIGFGAEDVAEVEPLLITRNAKGEIEGVKYDRLSVVFVNAIKEQQEQLQQQQKLIEQLRAQLLQQQAQLNQVKRTIKRKRTARNEIAHCGYR